MSTERPAVSYQPEAQQEVPFSAAQVVELLPLTYGESLSREEMRPIAMLTLTNQRHSKKYLHQQHK